MHKVQVKDRANQGVIQETEMALAQKYHGKIKTVTWYATLKIHQAEKH